MAKAKGQSKTRNRRDEGSKHEILLFPPADSVVGQQYYYVTQRPWPSLLFVLPMLLIFELGSYLRQGGTDPKSIQLVATFLIEKMVEVFGSSGFFFPGLAMLAILLAIHLVGRHPWKFDAYVLPGMLGESLIWALPLLIFNRVIHQAILYGGQAAQDAWLDQVIRCFGAGLYEELVFRLIFITFGVMVLVDVFKLNRMPAAIAIIFLSALLFASQHHPPLGAEPFNIVDFTFRAVAGLYLAGLFVFRGFGIAAGCHSFYNVIVVTMAAIRGL